MILSVSKAKQALEALYKKNPNNKEQEFTVVGKITELRPPFVIMITDNVKTNVPPLKLLTLYVSKVKVDFASIPVGTPIQVTGNLNVHENTEYNKIDLQLKITSISPLKTVSLSDFFELIDQKISFNDMSVSYAIEGDIVSVHNVNKLTLIELTDTAIGNPRLMVKISTEKLSKENIALTENIRIQVTGTIGIYKGHGKLQIAANSISVLDNVLTRRQKQLESWKKELTDSGWDKKSTRSIKKELASVYKTKSNIGVITSLYSQKGYGDFYTTIRKDYYNVKTIETTLSAKNIANAITEFNNDEDTEYICIMRGGGSSYDLLDFNNPILLKAMYESALPIITGIGHYDDISLCTQLADENFKTPNEVASELNRIKNKAFAAAKAAGSKASFQKELSTINSGKDIEIETLKKENTLFKQRIAELENENQELTVQLAKVEGASLFSKIRNFLS